MIKQKKILCISHHKEVELGLLENFFLINNFKIDIQKPLYSSEKISNFCKDKNFDIIICEF